MTLVCAPAGSGKTVLLRGWADQLEEAVAWVAVERGERDAQHFWLSLIDALAGADGGEVIERVSPAPSFAGAAVLERLLDQLRRLDERIVLVIDDLHELDSADAVEWLETLLERLPPQLRVVIATREDSSLRLHRMRLAGELAELRGEDLRFSLEETRALLARSGISLSDRGLASLQERTEGWPAGLRLAAISLSAHPDPELFVSEFSGSERTVARYLLAEVLERQPPEVRELLLRTSIVERVNGRLADALTGATGGEAILLRLEDENAFVTSLDPARTWFRYHHLFADLLRLELRRSEPAAIPSLHRITAGWHEQQGEIVEAVGHYQQAGDWEAAAGLLVESYLALTMAGRRETLHALLERFPAEARLRDGELSCGLAVDAIFHGGLDDAFAHLRRARRLAGEAPARRRRLLEGYVAATALELARRQTDLPAGREAMRSLQAALATDPDQAQLRPEYVTLSLMNLGITELWAGEPEMARAHLEEALDRTRRNSRPFIEIGCLAHLALVAPLGTLQLPHSLDLCERALAIAEEHGWSSESMTTGAFAMAGIALAWLGRLEEAEPKFERATQSLRAVADPGTEVTVHHGLGMLRFAQGRFDEAVAEFERAAGLQRQLVSEHVIAVEARNRELQVRVRAGDTDGVRAALERLSPPERGRASARIALAALELELGDPGLAVQALAPVIDTSAPAFIQRWARAEALLLDAIARDRIGERAAAEASLEATLELAEPEGLILPFIVWPARELLERHPRHRTAHATLISTILDALAGRGAGAPREAAGLLSDAELRVVRYLPSNLTAVEIASELIVSANTVRTHMRHIYAKLDAHTRSEAVTRARELGLIGPGAVRR